VAVEGIKQFYLLIDNSKFCAAYAKACGAFYAQAAAEALKQYNVTQQDKEEV